MERRDGRWTDDAVPESVALHLQNAASLASVAEPEWSEHIEAAAVPLGALRRRAEAGTLSVRDDFGAVHSCDLGDWRNEADDVRIIASFSYQQRSTPPGLRGTVYPNDLLDRIVA